MKPDSAGFSEVIEDPRKRYAVEATEDDYRQLAADRCVACLEPRPQGLQTEMVLALLFSASGDCQIRASQLQQPNHYSTRSAI